MSSELISYTFYAKIRRNGKSTLMTIPKEVAEMLKEKKYEVVLKKMEGDNGTN